MRITLKGTRETSGGARLSVPKHYRKYFPPCFSVEIETSKVWGRAPSPQKAFTLKSSTILKRMIEGSSRRREARGG